MRTDDKATIHTYLELLNNDSEHEFVDWLVMMGIIDSGAEYRRKINDLWSERSAERIIAFLENLYERQSEQSKGKLKGLTDAQKFADELATVKLDGMDEFQKAIATVPNEEETFQIDRSRIKS